jgi:hypothetical protein
LFVTLFVDVTDRAID